MLMRRYRSSRSTLTLCLEILEDRSLPSVSGLGAVLVDADLPGLGHLAERASHGLDNGIGSIVSSLVHSGIIGPALAEQIHTDLGRGNGPPDSGPSSNHGDADSSSAQNSGASSSSSSSSASASISTSGPSSRSSASQGETYSVSLSSTSVATSSSAVPITSASGTLQEGNTSAQSAQTTSSYSSSLSAGAAQPVSSSPSSSAAVEPAAPTATSRSAGQAPPELSKTGTTDIMPAAPMTTQGPPPTALPVEVATAGPAVAGPVAAFGHVLLADGPLAIATPQAALPAVAGVEIITTAPGPQDRGETDNFAPQGSDDLADLAPETTVEEPDVLVNFFTNLYELADSGRMRKALPWAAAGLLTAAACEITRRQLWQRRRELPLDGSVANALPDDPAGLPPGEEP